MVEGLFCGSPKIKRANRTEGQTAACGEYQRKRKSALSCLTSQLKAFKELCCCQRILGLSQAQAEFSAQFMPHFNKSVTINKGDTIHHSLMHFKADQSMLFRPAGTRIVTLAKDVMFSPLLVCMSVCLFVCM